MIKIPENLKSSKGDGKIARTIKGSAFTVIFLLAYYTPYTEEDWVFIANAVLVAVSALYALHGAVRKVYNRKREVKI